MGDQFLVSDLYFNPNVCHTCKIYSDSIKTCTGCHMISYCSKEHQKFHWPSHKSLCKCLQAIRRDLGKDYYRQINISNVDINAEDKPLAWSKPKAKYSAQITESSNETHGNTLTGELVNHGRHKESPEIYSEVSTSSMRNAKEKNLEKVTNNDELGVEIGNLNITTETKSMSRKNANEHLLAKGSINNIVVHSIEQQKEQLSREWTQNRLRFLDLVEKLMGTNVRNVEKEIILNPKCCIVCKLRSTQLKTCDSCLSVNYCTEHSNLETHAFYCQQFSLLYKINKFIVDKYLTNSFGYLELISNFLEPYEFHNDMKSHELSEYTSYYRTLAHVIQCLKFSSRSLTVHVIGASEYECSPYAIYLWENIFHRINFLDTITIIFVGFQVTADQFDMRLCQGCVDSGRKMNIECYQMSYDEYIDMCHDKTNPNKTQYSDAKVNICTDLIIAYDSGFHEYENHSHNPWAKTLSYFLRTENLPIAFTAYTKEEIIRDTHMITNLAQERNVTLDFIMEGEINAEASKKPRIDPEEGIYYFNKYISCFYCK